MSDCTSMGASMYALMNLPATLAGFCVPTLLDSEFLDLFDGKGVQKTKVKGGWKML